MFPLVFEVMLIGIWSMTLVYQGRRLVRLSKAGDRQWPWRFRLSRLWWWLGREEFWTGVRADSLRCVQLTMLLFMLTWYLSQ
jgi:hypothetical protein